MRKEEQEKELKEKLELDHIFNTSDEEFLPNFKEAAKEIRVKHLLECKGGSI